MIVILNLLYHETRAIKASCELRSRNTYTNVSHVDIHSNHYATHLTSDFLQKQSLDLLNTAKASICPVTFGILLNVCSQD